MKVVSYGALLLLCHSRTFLLRSVISTIHKKIRDLHRKCNEIIGAELNVGAISED